MTGLSRQQAAEAVAALFGATAIHSRSSRTYDPWEVTDNEGKTWRFVFDASIRATHRSGRRQLSTGDDTYKVEMNSPKLEYSEMGKLQDVVRTLRHAGAVVNSSCGMHVHVDASKHTPQSLKNALSIMYSKEDILFKALNVDERRVERWCQKVREPMLEKIRRLPTNTTMDRLKREWYEGGDGSYEHYNWTRYYALNLHSVFYRGTVEWRCFNSTLHAGRAKATSTCASPCLPRPSPSAAPSCGKPTATMSCSPSGSGWCAWASMAMSSGRPAICCWRIWMGTGPGASTRTAMKSIETRRKNIVRRRGDHEDTN